MVLILNLKRAKVFGLRPEAEEIPVCTFTSVSTAQNNSFYFFISFFLWFVSVLMVLVLVRAGLAHEGIYRKNGAKSRIKLLMDEFRKDARNVKLRIGDHFIEDVTDVLKRFFREIDDPVFMAELHPLWQGAASQSAMLTG